MIKQDLNHLIRITEEVAFLALGSKLRVITRNPEQIIKLLNYYIQFVDGAKFEAAFNDAMQTLAEWENENV